MPYNASAYMKEWRKRRKAAGLPISGSKTWAPEKRAAWHEKNAEARRAYAAEWQRKSRLRADVVVKHKARRVTRSAIERGELVRQACQCGNVKTEAHHDDYSKPLEVRWMCATCHREHHQKARG